MSSTFESNVDADTNWRATRVKMFEMGHTFEYIDGLKTQDYLDIINYWSGKSKAEEFEYKKARRK